MTLLSKSTLSKMLYNLEKIGFVKRIQSKDDKRTILIQLSKDSKIFKERYIEVSKEMTKIFYNKFTDKEIHSLENYLVRILKNLKMHTIKE